MRGLLQSRRKEHRHDEAVRQVTAETLSQHRKSLQRVRSTLAQADETLAQEIQRLDAALRGAHQ